MTDHRDLFHFTCGHGRVGLLDHGLVKPAAILRPTSVPLSQLLPARYAWFTDLALPVRDALGLTTNFSSCDRTVHRYRADDPTRLVPWVEIRKTVPAEWRDTLEAAPGARLMHWWVSADPVEATYAP